MVIKFPSLLQLHQFLARETVPKDSVLAHYLEPESDFGFSAHTSAPLGDPKSWNELGTLILAPHGRFCVTGFTPYLFLTSFLVFSPSPFLVSTSLLSWSHRFTILESPFIYLCSSTAYLAFYHSISHIYAIFSYLTDTALNFFIICMKY